MRSSASSRTSRRAPSASPSRVRTSPTTTDTDVRVAIFGSGGVGGYFGARLAAAGNEVHFIARGAHLDAMRSRGLKVESGAGNVHLPNPLVHEDPSEVGSVDAVIFAVKLWDVESAAAKVKPLLRDKSVVIPFQNGIEAPELL